MGTPIVGFNGQVDLGVIVDSDVAYQTHAWSLDIAGDTLDTTGFTSDGWRTFLAGLKGWTGSVELYVDDTNQVQPSDVNAAAVDSRFYLNSTDYLHGKVIVNGWSPATTVDGLATQSLTIQGTSDLWFTGA